jgi:bacterioferritin
LVHNKNRSKAAERNRVFALGQLFTPPQRYYVRFRLILPHFKYKEKTMNGHPEIIEVLNEALTAELTAINQYFAHSEICENWGYERLHQAIREHSIGEMKHAEELIARVLYLNAMPNMARYFEIKIGANVEEMMTNDLALETEAVERLNEFIQLAHTHKDFGSEELLERVLKDEEEHIDWIEAQLDQINQVGIQNYLAQQIISDEEEA